MPIIANFSFARYQDGILEVCIQPPTPVGGWDTRFTVWKHFGGISGIIQKSVASGFNGASGISVTSGVGRFRIQINSADTSGLEYGNYAGTLERFDSGSRTPLSEGFLTITP